MLLANLGTPDGYDYWSMRRYLGEFLSDKRVIDYSSWLWQPLLQLVILSKRPFTSGANYKLIWNHELNESPLMTITKAQTAKLAAALHERHGNRVMVDFCMRYGNPSTESKVRAMVEAGCEKVLFFPLYPHYAGATSATANDQFFRAMMKEKRQPAVRTVAEYFDHPLYIEASRSRCNAPMRAGPSAGRSGGQLSRDAEAVSGIRRPLPLPVRQDVAVAAGTAGLGEGVDRHDFQSVFGPEEWLRP